VTWGAWGIACKRVLLPANAGAREHDLLAKETGLSSAGAPRQTAQRDFPLPVRWNCKPESHPYPPLVAKVSQTHTSAGEMND